MRPCRQSLLLALALAGLASGLAAQERADDLFPENLETQLLPVFGPQRAFTAHAQITASDDHDRELGSMTTLYVYLQGQTRTETDFAELKPPLVSPKDLAALAQMGLTRSVEILRPDQNLSYLVFPSIKSWCKILPPKPAAAKPRAPPKIEKRQTGQATVDHHPCLQYQLTITDSDANPVTLTTWEATDLQALPIRVRLRYAGHTVTVLLRDIDQHPPDRWLFDPPAGYRQFDDFDDLILRGTRPVAPGF